MWKNYIIKLGNFLGKSKKIFLGQDFHICGEQMDQGHETDGQGADHLESLKELGFYFECDGKTFAHLRA